MKEKKVSFTFPRLNFSWAKMSKEVEPIFVSYNLPLQIVSHSCFSFLIFQTFYAAHRSPFSTPTLVEIEQVFPKPPKCSMIPYH